MLTFLYKTVFKNRIDGRDFKLLRKNGKAVKEDDGLCSHASDGVNAKYSHYSHDTCGGRGRFAAGRKLNQSQPPAKGECS